VVQKPRAVQCCVAKRDRLADRLRPTGLHFSPRGEAKCVRRPSGRGARRLARGSVLEQYVEHGKQAQRSPGGLIACFGRQVCEKCRLVTPHHTDPRNLSPANSTTSSRCYPKTFHPSVTLEPKTAPCQEGPRGAPRRRGERPFGFAATSQNRRPRFSELPNEPVQARFSRFRRVTPEPLSASPPPPGRPLKRPRAAVKIQPHSITQRVAAKPYPRPASRLSPVFPAPQNSPRFTRSANLTWEAQSAEQSR